MDVIDFTAERNRRAQPDPELVSQDEYDRPLYTFGAECEMEGRSFSFTLVAYSWEDAEVKVAAIRDSAKVFGQLFSQVPA